MAKGTSSSDKGDGVEIEEFNESTPVEIDRIRKMDDPNSTQIWFAAEAPNIITVEKGKILTKEMNGSEIRRIRRSDPNNLKYINESTWEVLEDIDINVGRIIPAGTKLDPKEDKELLELLRVSSPNIFNRPKSADAEKLILAKLEITQNKTIQETEKQKKLKALMEKSKTKKKEKKEEKKEEKK